mmetsp:Transcript_1574/g.2567  ORF Transcript_1574/g.2567 Transcript_1574/m.2567 type:complete len:586 (+) Transcript_1574:2-1759(+)|eukprot:CAMPEP_0196815850 /NCGR_PEP_ID=MMETSP1362-20130617/52313_1 /TAXON_ID=163516 /ORGANISM="Leptocylindrus danicus, Strain CCMP1856" /LENGTH=585 /DNA_ID=CAMNT_0042192981 /DNA_START=20 /DNA_END=1777 /DNA_ORIENTATION=+
MSSSSSSRDVDYTLEIAKRSVARAALHLNITEIADDALDALAQILLAYLNQMGEVLGEASEESGRSSAHVNAFDALYAIEATLALQPGLMMNNNNNNTNNTNNTNNRATAGGHRSAANSCWEDVAAFAFGPEWRTRSLLPSSSSNDDDDDATTEEQSNTTTTTTTMNDTNETTIRNHHHNNKPEESSTATTTKKEERIKQQQQQQQHNNGGWYAPYLDVVLPYPCRRTKTLQQQQRQIRIEHQHQKQQQESYRSVEESCFEPLVDKATSTSNKQTTSSSKIEGKQTQMSIAARRKAMQAESNMDKQLRNIPDGAFLWGVLKEPTNATDEDEINTTSAANATMNGSSSSSHMNNNAASTSVGAEDVKMTDVSNAKDDGDKAGGQQAAGNKADAKGSDEPSSKRVKIAALNGGKAALSSSNGNSGTSKTQSRKANKNGSNAGDVNSMSSSSWEPRPSYIPSFCPPFPPPHTYLAQSVASVPAAAKSTSTSTSTTDTNDYRVNIFVRDNLVRLKKAQQQQSSSLINVNTNGSGAASQHPKENNGSLNLTVPGGAKPEQSEQQRSLAAPLSLPSGSRVTRILEGSLDAA